MSDHPSPAALSQDGAVPVSGRPDLDRIPAEAQPEPLRLQQIEERPIVGELRASAPPTTGRCPTRAPIPPSGMNDRALSMRAGSSSGSFS